MKPLFTFLLLSFVTVVCAQPTITDAIIPQSGTSSTFRLFNAANVSPGSTGASVTWDFSGIPSNGTAIFDYKDPTNMPASSTFPNANLGVDQNGDPQLYFLASSQELLQLGGQIGTITENYNNDPKKVLAFPMTFGTVLTDTFEGTAKLSGITATRLGTAIIEGDGYGTLMLPYATFSDVLRVRSVSVYEDKVAGNVVNSGTDTVYSWYMNGVKDYLFTWSNISSDQFGTVAYGAYLDTMFVGLKESKILRDNLSVYPNPTQEIITLEYPATSEEKALIQLIDLTGKLHKTWTVTSTNGVFKSTISLANLNKGTYILKVSQGNRNEFKKIVLVN